jgi:hypothetical protein
MGNLAQWRVFGWRVRTLGVACSLRSHLGLGRPMAPQRLQDRLERVRPVRPKDPSERLAPYQVQQPPSVCLKLLFVAQGTLQPLEVCPG